MQKFALVTGASRGIGKAIALQLAQDGYDIFVHYRQSIDQAQNVADQIRKLGRQAYVIQADITQEAEVEQMFVTITQTTKSLDLLVNNAGMDYGLLFEEYTLSQMREVIDAILWSKIITTKFALPLLKNNPASHIINIASRMGREKTVKTISAYGPAQAGVIKFTQCMALELADYHIRANCVAPGLTKTDLTEKIFSDEQSWKAIAELNPSKRVGQPQDVANVVSFLASTKAAYINGEVISVNGGSNLV